MIVIKYVYTVQGGHTHCNIYAGNVPPDYKTAGYTLGKCGSLTFVNEEFALFKNVMIEAEATHYDESLIIEFVEHHHHPA